MDMRITHRTSRATNVPVARSGKRTANAVCRTAISLMVTGMFVGVGSGVAAAKTTTQSESREASGSVEVLKLGLADSSTSPTYTFCERFAKLLSQETAGKLRVTVYPSEELGSTSAEASAVESGAQAFLVTGDFDSVVPEIDLDILPFLFSTMVQAQHGLNSPQMATALWDSFHKYGIQVVGTYPIGPLGIMTSKANVDSISALKGLRIRVPAPLVTDPLLNALHMDPTPVDPKEVLSTLSTGLLSGVYDPPTPIVDQGWDVYAKSYVELHANFNVDPVAMSLKVWNSLSRAEEADVTTAFRKTENYANSVIDEQNSAAVKAMETKGIKVYTLPRPALEKAASAAFSSYDKKFGKTEVEKVEAAAKAATGS